MKSTATLIAVISLSADRLTRAVGSATNVAAEHAGTLPEDLVAASRAIGLVWERARAHRTVYTVVDVDPLATVVGQWSRRLSGEEADLETAIGLVGDLPLPDFYLIGDDLDAPDVHWYLGAVEPFAPSRVVVFNASPQGLTAAIAALPPGPELPAVGVLAARARTFVPLPSVQVPGRPLLSGESPLR